MALSQVGGRPGASTGSGSGAGKEVGEVFLVPNTFSSPDVVEAGSTVTAQTAPDLFPKLVDGAAISGFQIASFPISDLTLGSRFIQGVQHQGEFYAVTQEGKVASTANGTTWTPRGTLATSLILPDSVLWPQSANVSGRATILMYSLGTRLIVINTLVKFCVGCYSDDKGVTWTNFSDTTINTVLAASLPTTQPMTIFAGTGYAIMVDKANRKIYRSTTGISNWTDVTGSANIAATASAIAPTSYADADVALFWISNIAYSSADAGMTWSVGSFNPGTSAIVSSIIKWNGTYYASGCLTTTVTNWKSTDGLNWSTSGNITVTSGYRPIYYIGTDGNLGLGGPVFSKSTDGSTWSAPVVAALSTTIFGLLPSGSGFKFLLVGIGYGAQRSTSDYGTTFDVVAAPAIAGSPTGISFWEAATNETGVTVMIGNQYLNGDRTTGADIQTAGSAYLTSRTFYYGSPASGWQVGQFPDAQVWTSITWNRYAGIFIVTARDVSGIYTSPDGANWTYVAQGSQAGFTSSVARMTARTFGIVTAFMPTSTTAVAMQMLIGRGDGTYFFILTPYTKAWTGWGDGTKFVEFAKTYVASTTQCLYIPDPALITSASFVNNPATGYSVIAGNVCVHNNTMVAKSSSVINTISINGKMSSSGSALVNTATYATDTQTLRAIWTNGSVIYAFVSDTAAGGIRVRTSTDSGLNWSSSVMNSIPSTETIVGGKVIGDVIYLFGTLNTYVADPLNGGSNATSKTLANGWVAPTGLKYVVQAK